MTCKHLRALEQDLINNSVEITFRGKAWSKNCREWVYFDRVFDDAEALIKQFNLDRKYVRVHKHIGTHDGTEIGVKCIQCHDGIMGRLPSSQ